MHPLELCFLPRTTPGGPRALGALERPDAVGEAEAGVWLFARPLDSAAVQIWSMAEGGGRRIRMQPCPLVQSPAQHHKHHRLSAPRGIRIFGSALCRIPQGCRGRPPVRAEQASQTRRWGPAAPTSSARATAAGQRCHTCAYSSVLKHQILPTQTAQRRSAGGAGPRAPMRPAAPSTRARTTLSTASTSNEMPPQPLGPSTHRCLAAAWHTAFRWCPRRTSRTALL